MVSKETVLLYNLKATEKGKKIAFVLIRMGVMIKHVDRKQYLQPIGALAGLKGIELVKEVYEDIGFVEEMLVMKGFSGGRIDQLLLQFRKNQIDKIQLKAVLTSSNMGWNSLELYEEIKKENELMSKKD